MGRVDAQASRRRQAKHFRTGAFEIDKATINLILLYPSGQGTYQYGKVRARNVLVQEYLCCFASFACSACFLDFTTCSGAYHSRTSTYLARKISCCYGQTGGGQKMTNSCEGPKRMKLQPGILIGYTHHCFFTPHKPPLSGRGFVCTCRQNKRVCGDNEQYIVFEANQLNFSRELPRRLFRTAAAGTKTVVTCFSTARATIGRMPFV
jgi:hypothetical protein